MKIQDLFSPSPRMRNFFVMPGHRPVSPKAVFPTPNLNQLIQPEPLQGININSKETFAADLKHQIIYWVSYYTECSDDAVLGPILVEILESLWERKEEINAKGRGVLIIRTMLQKVCQHLKTNADEERISYLRSLFKNTVFDSVFYSMIN